METTIFQPRSTKETACLGPLQQQVQLAPDLLSEADESFGTNTPGRVKASWIQDIGVGLSTEIWVLALNRK
jgi:hypothetical protein